MKGNVADVAVRVAARLPLFCVWWFNRSFHVSDLRQQVRERMASPNNNSTTEPIFGIPLTPTQYVQHLYSHCSFVTRALKPVGAFSHTQQSCHNRQYTDIASKGRISDSQWSGAVDLLVHYILSDLGEKELYPLCTPTQLLGPKL